MWRTMPDLQAAGIDQVTGSLEYVVEQGELVKPKATHDEEPLSEREVLRLIAVGLSNRDIAEELVLATGTVKKHINNIFTKLNVRSRTQAVSQAREFNLL